MSNFLKKFYLCLIYTMLYLPILILILYSINTAKFSLQWHGMTLRWYHELFADHDLWGAVYHSFWLAICAAVLATGLSCLACVHIFMFKRNKHKLLYGLIILLIIIPDLVLGVALLIFFNLAHIPLGFSSLLIAHITFCIPFTMMTLAAQINTLDHNIYLSALDLGASRLRALTQIILPLLWPSILSAFLLSFTLSFDDVITSYFVAGPDYNILPLTIYSLVRAGVSPELNALCTITLALSLIPVLIANRLTGKLL